MSRKIIGRLPAVKIFRYEVRNLSLPLFTLGGRLQLCASMVRPGAALADIGTDHAYLPIWLAKKGLVSRAIGGDIRPGPLQKAQDNILRYHVQDTVSARLSDGLHAVSPSDADDIVIAGMGGEMIIRIIGEALWLKDTQKHLILQPMTSAEPLRLFLAEQNFEVLREEAAEEDGRVYTVMLVQYSTEQVCVDELYPHIGKLKADTQAAEDYIRRRITNLGKRHKGLVLTGRQEEAAALGGLIDRLKAMSERKSI